MKPGNREPREWVEQVQRMGIELRRKGSEWVGPCPVCGEGDDRFHVGPKAGGGTLVGCRKCESAFGLLCREIWGDTRNRRPSHPQPHNNDSRPDHSWDIRDSNGRLIAQHLRWNARNGSGKRFAWRRDGKSGLVGLPAAELPLYLSELVNEYAPEEPLYIVEGEAAADALRGIGAQVVGTVTGAASVPSEAAWRILSTFTECVVWPDLDEAGRKHAERCATALEAINPAANIRILSPEGLGLSQPGSDAVEWVERHQGRGEEWTPEAILGELVSVAPQHSQPFETTAGKAEAPHSPILISVDIPAFLDMPMKPRSWLLRDLIQERDIAMIHAPRGIGKIYSATSIAWAIASGTSWLRFAAERPAGVLYCDGEMHAQDLQARFQEISRGMGNEVVKPLRLLSVDAIRLLDPPACDLVLPSLATVEGQAMVRAELKAHPEIELVIIDSISTLCQTDCNESDPRSWEPMQKWLLELRRDGIATLVLHHGGKDGRQRGTSKREDVMTQVLRLQRPPDYEPDQGARFEIHFDKGRAVYGEAARPLEAQLSTKEGAAQWSWKDLEQSTRERAFALFQDGAKYQEVMEELTISRSHSLRLQKAYREGHGK